MSSLVQITSKDVSKHIDLSFREIKKSSSHRNIDSNLAPSQRDQHNGGISSDFSILNTVNNMEPKTPVLSSEKNDFLQHLNKSIAIATAVLEKYSEFEINRLNDAKTHQRISSDDLKRLSRLQSTSAHIVVFVIANYLESKLISADMGGAKSTVEVDLILNSPLKATRSLLLLIHDALTTDVNSEADIASVIADLLEKVKSKISLNNESLDGIEPFLSVSYEVEGQDFVVKGFESDNTASTPLVMDFVKPEQVIGNAIAKQQALRLAKQIMCYDMEKQMNPFVELGGFTHTFIGDGFPGTGKTTLIKMMAGLISGYCEVAGYKFRYENLSVSDVSDYQGRSGRRAKEFIQSLSDPKVIGFGTIDDVDQVAGMRGDKQSSQGQQEITASLMESLAGANTRILGNSTIGMFTNYPDKVDSALRQRAQARFAIDGPQTVFDYTDIFALMLGDNHSLPVGDIELYASQSIQEAAKASYESHNEPHSEKLMEAYQKTIKAVGEIDTIEKVGIYLHNIKEADETFTGRAISNIMSAIKTRTMDFDLPDEWFQDPELFLRKTYDEKVQMLKSMQSEVTPKMIIQEINRYSDSEFRYKDKSEEAYIDKRVNEYLMNMKAEERLKQELSTN